MSTTLLNQNIATVQPGTRGQLTVIMGASSTALVDRYMGETLLETTPLSATTVYLVAKSDFITDTLSAYGQIRARRMR